MTWSKEILATESAWAVVYTASLLTRNRHTLILSALIAWQTYAWDVGRDAPHGEGWGVSGTCTAVVHLGDP
jgi:hypothetical protein